MPLRLLVVLIVLALCTPAEAQQPAKVPRIGYLGSGSSFAAAPLYDAFRQGLHELGYIEGKNIIIEHRYGGDNPDRYPAVAAELVHQGPHVIVAAGGLTAAVKNTTNMISIVFVNVDDPVASGYVVSLARPGGNVTGLISASGPGFAGKRLEVLKETLLKVSRVAVLWNPNNTGSIRQAREMEAAASLLGIKYQAVEIREANDLKQAFLNMKKERSEALMTMNSPLVTSQLKQIVDLAAEGRLPTLSSESRWTEAGGLMSYGPSYADLSRRASVYADKILKGAKPAELPVEQPTKFESLRDLFPAPWGVKYSRERVYS